MSRASDAYEALSLAMLSTSPGCKGIDLFTADDITKADMDVLRAICDECPVFAFCEEYAQIDRPKAGYWAGRRYRTNAPRKATDE